MRSNNKHRLNHVLDMPNQERFGDRLHQHIANFKGSKNLNKLLTPLRSYSKS
jgi:uncharacterized membrane protein